MFKRSLAALALGGLALGVAAQTKWDLASAYPPNNFHTENLVQFGKDVAEATGGKLQITVHSNASLFKAPEIKRAVQGNQVQLGEILLVNYQNEWQLFGVDGLPFLATSYAEARKLHVAQKPVLQKRLADQGMVLLYTVAWPPQGLFSKKPISSLDDLKGSKWRAYSPSTSRIAELIGAQPVTVQAAELSQALATGVVESFMTSGATGYDSKVFEHLKYYYNFQAWLPKNAVIMNKRAFDALDKATQDAVLKAAAAAEERGWKVSEEKDREYLDLLKKNGMEIVEPSPQLKEQLRKQVGEPMLKEWLEKAGPEGKAVVEAFQKS
ncbi:TRAP transporter substrate-binding protein [Caldimonas thermodepolymerans]|jgi:TRAP-type C4-dicarboxylate transport system substrate-binding protein|uniref:TRAP transporter substrate-binding protein n=1 Tax=Caldimonas thermodepolymerans TaxID=215580 RepID=UPI0024934448|nr:TRAP transporter substrate-binding protein [Caldimonas thermodepolymerans]